MIDHIAINVKEIKTSAEWYSNHFGFEISYIDETWAMLKKGQTKIALTLKEQHPPHIAFLIESVDDFPSNDFKYHRDGSAYLYSKDPDGNVVEYICYNTPES
jgi:catechol 2,3-dioxygenase-like lactoylglutathione lyase family enzyme